MKKTTITKKPTGRPSKFSKPVRDRIIQAIGAGCTYDLAADYAGISRKTLWDWLKKGQDPKNKEYVTFRTDIKRAEAEGAISNLGTIKQASVKDWKAAAWLLERRHHFHRDGVSMQEPQEEVHLPSNPLDLLKEQAKDLKSSMMKAEQSQSWQAYAALQRQLLQVVQQIRLIEAEEGLTDEMEGLTDEQLLQEITNAIVSLPPILRQRLESNIGDTGSNILKFKTRGEE